MYLQKFNRINILKQFIRNESSNQIVPEITEVRQITQEDLNKFSILCGDLNPIHSETYPEKERYVNGAYLNGLIAGLIGTKVPGPGSIVISQKFKFPRKCRVNEDIIMNVKLIENRKIMKVLYSIKQNDQIVFQGEANLLRKLIIKH